MAFEKYLIREFMNALYSGDRSVMDEKELNEVNAEYTDIAGLYDEDEFSKTAYIYYLNNRVNSIKLAIRLQKEFMNNFDIPFVKELKFFKKFGHNILWKNDKKDFLRRLEIIEEREAKYETEMEDKISELTKARLKKNNKEKTHFQSRHSFIRMINTLGKLGYKISMNETTVEELAIMIKQQSEENKNTNAK